VFILRKTCKYSVMVFLSCIQVSSLVDGTTIDQTAYLLTATGMQEHMLLHTSSSNKLASAVLPVVYKNQKNVLVYSEIFRGQFFDEFPHHPTFWIMDHVWVPFRLDNWDSVVM